MRSGPFLFAVAVTLLLVASCGALAARAPAPEMPLPSERGASGSVALPSITPIVQAQAKPNPADVGSSLNFYGIFSGVTGTYTLNWSFGDGTYSNAQYPVHIYLMPANYTVVFTVSSLCCMTGSATIHVLINTDIQAGVGFSPTNPTTSTAVNFTTTPSLGTPPYSGFWNFGDGTTAIGLSALHTFHSAGTYTVRVWANDSGEGSASQVLHVTVSGGGGGSQPTGGTGILIGTTAAAAAVGVGGFAYFQWEKKRRPKLPAATPPPGAGSG